MNGPYRTAATPPPEEPVDPKIQHQAPPRFDVPRLPRVEHVFMQLFDVPEEIPATESERYREFQRHVLQILSWHPMVRSNPNGDYDLIPPNYDVVVYPESLHRKFIDQLNCVATVIAEAEQRARLVTEADALKKRIVELEAVVAEYRLVTGIKPSAPATPGNPGLADLQAACKAVLGPRWDAWIHSPNGYGNHPTYYQVGNELGDDERVYNFTTAAAAIAGLPRIAT